jgi:hypothetical protein
MGALQNRGELQIVANSKDVTTTQHFKIKSPPHVYKHFATMCSTELNCLGVTFRIGANYNPFILHLLLVMKRYFMLNRMLVRLQQVI